ncbi:2-oxoglutarate and iron-dependent oxygenase JMJD4 homolog isoform X1 [Colias croceus]|uniref:2-oxoglutarate and iron-dependent oxygenase JMJD4 homolog isoform X1 n=1 Tax=Colias crocea TaxID=72248 RepID=UPI001E27F10A|nr:2-oxoglutarate and iron-dependent oxygenase JMJD4 homolog isoform X1 [Colias croceus]
MQTLEINNIHRSIFQTQPNYCQIPVVDYKNLPYDTFFEKFMLPNAPVIIQNICNEWESSKHWVVNDKINYDYFITNYGEFEAPIADCNKINFNAQCKCDMKIIDYINYLKNENKQEVLYLKDWHLKATLQKENLAYNFYKVPTCFASDWLNEYAEDMQEDDFRFVYIGPKDSWTPLHADVYSSYSWSVNVVGRKKWVLFPPGEEEKLKDTLGNLPLLFNTQDHKNIKYFEIIQEKGDAIFVPSGWYHQVFNLHDTISVNHNFINSCNIEKVWMALLKNLEDVEKEIAEFKDSPEFVSQCQVILKSLFGMDMQIFVNFIIYIAKKRVNQMHGKKFTVFNDYTFGNNHIAFDLKILLKILKYIDDHPLINNKIISQDLISEHHDIIKKISEIMK